MRWFIVTLSIFLAAILASAQDDNLSVFLIPDSLKDGADAVVRYDHIELKKGTMFGYSYSRKKAVTILNENGLDQANLIFPYSKDTRISSIQARSYNSFGDKIETWYRKDFKDTNFDIYGNMFDDTRQYSLRVNSLKFPFTISYEVVYYYPQQIIVPDWDPISDTRVSVQKSSYSMLGFVKEEFRFKEQNFNDAIEHVDLGQTKKWVLEGFKPVEEEVFMPKLRMFLPSLIVEPNMLKYNSYRGEMSTWSSFGDFFSSINEGLDYLPEEALVEVREVVKPFSTDIERAKALYKYMQSRTRYMSIQLGIGGIRPFSAVEVHEHGYGDCKALTNYMMTLLRYVGIQSFYTLIRSGDFEASFDKSFVHDPFNHVILFLPMENDTIWLECTSQIIPFGHLSGNTKNKHALIIDGTNSRLVKTPQTPQELNYETRKAKIVLSEDGNAEIQSVTEYGGLEFDNFFWIYHEDAASQKDELYEKYNVSGYRINSIDLKILDSGTNLKGHEILKLSKDKYATKSGKRMFIPTNEMNRHDYVPPADKDRVHDIYLKYAYVEMDSIQFILPKGYRIEHMPMSNEYDSEFGSIKVDYELKADTLSFYRTLKMNKGMFSSSQYEEFLNFRKQVRKNDKAKLIMVKEE